MKILVVDDEEAIRVSLGGLLGRKGYDVRLAEHAPEALELLEEEGADLVITDLSMPSVDGLELFDLVRARRADQLVVLMTAFGDERTAVRALKQGLYDYVPKPFGNDEILAVVERASEVLALRKENAGLLAELTGPFHGLIGRSPSMRAVYELITKVGPTTASVLITGESGTGKELAARALHEESTARRGPFVALNCSALPSDLVEAELFGHTKGAFTGADAERCGLIEAADGGTLFLDEVGDLAPAAQAKMLRVVEDRKVTRLGSNNPVAVDVRLIAATNRDLEADVAAGSFREDLLFRLRVVTIHLPPLRDRREDITRLAVEFLRHFSEVHGRDVAELTDSARGALGSYGWPGNVRELKNVVERAVVLASSDRLDVGDLPPEVSGRSVEAVAGSATDVPFAEAREEAIRGFERSYLEAALERHGGNISETARELGLHRQSLQRTLKRVGIRPSEGAGEDPRSR